MGGTSALFQSHLRLRHLLQRLRRIEQMSRLGRLKESAARRGARGLLKVGIYIIIALVSFYGDGVFVWMNIGHYSGQYAVVFQIFLILGAFCTSASIMALLAGKASWFTPGTQMLIAYIFTGVEVAVNLLNIIVALNPDLGIVEYWRIFSPATPFVALIGWVIILQVDKEQRERHAQLEMQEEVNNSEREYQIMVHEANMDLKFGYLDQTKQRLQAALNSPQAQAIVEQHAQNLTAQVLNEITGLPVMSQLPQPIVPAIDPHTQPLNIASLPNTSSVPAKSRTCDSCGKGGPGAFDGSVWFCQDCLQKVAEDRAKPYMTSGDLIQMFEQWQAKQQPETKPDTAMDEWFNLYKKSGESGVMSFPAFMKKMRDATNPLPKSPLDNSQANHEGQNGNK
jgi:ribosomal protein L37AE/L43A